jgi:hypothetical protein
MELPDSALGFQVAELHGVVLEVVVLVVLEVVVLMVLAEQLPQLLQPALCAYACKGNRHDACNQEVIAYLVY